MEQRGAEVNQRDSSKGWTPLHRAARMAHHTHVPYLAVFEYLLTKGADASLLTTVGLPDHTTARILSRVPQGFDALQRSVPVHAASEFSQLIPSHDLSPMLMHAHGERLKHLRLHDRPCSVLQGLTGPPLSALDVATDKVQAHNSCL